MTLLVLSALLSLATADVCVAPREIAPGVPACTLAGRVKFVDAFADYRIRFVEAFPDIRVQYVESFPDEPGRCRSWRAFRTLRCRSWRAFRTSRCRSSAPSRAARNAPPSVFSCVAAALGASTAGRRPSFS